MTNKKFIDNIAKAFIKWDAVCILLNPECHPLKDLISPVSNGIHRGIHESVRNAKKIIPIFYWGLGWVDVSYELWLEIIDRFNLDRSKLRTNPRLNDREIKNKK